MKTHKIRKLYYKKFPYRVTLHATWINQVNHYYHRDINPGYMKFKKDIDQLTIYIKSNKNNDEIKFRKEWNTLNVYFTDLSLLDEIKTLFKNSLRELHQPDPECIDYLISNRYSIVSDELPHGCRYKVFLNAKKTPVNVRKNLIKYAQNNQDKINIPGSVNEFFNSERSSWWTYQLYFYVKDEKILLFVQMLLAGGIKEIHYIATTDEVKNAKQQEAIEIASE
jgi:hypothetical protein